MANSRLIGSVLLGALALAGCTRVASGGGAGLIPGVARWYSQYRLPTSSNLRAVRAADANTVIIAGDATSILRSDDGGATWVQLEHTPFALGGDIAALDSYGANVHAVGSDSTNGNGRSWLAINGVLDWTTSSAVAAGPPYTSVDVVSSTDAYYLRSDGTVELVVGGALTSSTAVPVAGPWLDVNFWGTTGTGYVAGPTGQIYKKISTSTTWTAETTPAMTGTIRKIWLVAEDVGYAVGDNLTVFQKLGGNWNRLGPVSADPRALRSVSFPVGISTGWVVGDSGLISKTTDGGSTWNDQGLGLTPVNLYDVWFVDNTTGYAVGDRGIVLKTTDGGTLWIRVPAGVFDSLTQLNAVDFSNDGSRGLAGGNNGLILRTLDGGATWTQTITGVATPILGVAVPKTGGGTAAYACSTGGQILKTTDFGATPWTVQTPAAAAGATLRAILFPAGDSTGIAAGDSAKILYTTTSGGTWTASTLPGSVPGTTSFKALSATPGGLALYAAGDGSVLLQGSVLGINTWSAGPGGLPGSLTLLALTSPPSGNLFTGAGDTVYRYVVTLSSSAPFAGTLVEGLTWKGSTGGIVEDVYGVATGTSQRGVFYTINGGTNWLRSYVHTNNDLHAIWMSPQVPGLGYAVGNNGTILKTTTGGK